MLTGKTYILLTILFLSFIFSLIYFGKEGVSKYDFPEKISRLVNSFWLFLFYLLLEPDIILFETALFAILLAVISFYGRKGSSSGINSKNKIKLPLLITELFLVSKIFHIIFEYYFPSAGEIIFIIVIIFTFLMLNSTFRKKQILFVKILLVTTAISMLFIIPALYLDKSEVSTNHGESAISVLIFFSVLLRLGYKYAKKVNVVLFSLTLSLSALLLYLSLVLPDNSMQVLASVSRGGIFMGIPALSGLSALFALVVFWKIRFELIPLLKHYFVTSTGVKTGYEEQLVEKVTALIALMFCIISGYMNISFSGTTSIVVTVIYFGIVLTERYFYVAERIFRRKSGHYQFLHGTRK